MIEESKRTIEGLLSQQVMDSSDNLEQVVQREEYKKGIINIRYEIMNDLLMKLFDNRVVKKFYANDSMDRFGDELISEILQYLTLEDMIRLECVFKQWKRFIYNKQFVLEIHGNNPDISKDSLKGLSGRMKSSNNVIISIKVLESVLKKCQNITKFASINSIYSNIHIDSKVLSIIGQYCPHIKSLYLEDYNYNDLSFFRDFGHKLEELCIRGTNDKIKDILKLCLNLKKVDLNYKNGWFVLSEDKLYLHKLEVPFSLGYACMQGYVRFNGIGEFWISMQAYVDKLAPPHNKLT